MSDGSIVLEVPGMCIVGIGTRKLPFLWRVQSCNTTKEKGLGPQWHMCEKRLPEGHWSAKTQKTQTHFSLDFLHLIMISRFYTVAT